MHGHGARGQHGRTQRYREQLALRVPRPALRSRSCHPPRQPQTRTRLYARRGGVYKNGAVVLHLSLDHDDIMEFVNKPRHELPWAKRCVDLTTEMWDNANENIQNAVINGIARGDIWLAKIRHDQQGRRIYANVCLEVFLRSRGTCLLEHINLAAGRPEDLPGAFSAGMTELI